MLMTAEKSALLVVDVQERLLPHIHDWQVLRANVMWLVGVAKKMGVPIMASEQYPKGLGHTDAELLKLLPRETVVEKLSFSCVGDRCLSGLPGNDREQVVVCGIESHVCVLQTALDLAWQGKKVYVVADSVGSRDPENKALALARMRAHGIEVVGREMVAFEWLRKAGSPLFREVSHDFLR